MKIEKFPPKCEYIYLLILLHSFVEILYLEPFMFFVLCLHIHFLCS